MNNQPQHVATIVGVVRMLALISAAALTFAVPARHHIVTPTPALREGLLLGRRAKPNRARSGTALAVTSFYEPARALFSDIRAPAALIAGAVLPLGFGFP